MLLFKNLPIDGEFLIDFNTNKDLVIKKLNMKAHACQSLHVNRYKVSGYEGKVVT